MANVSPRPLLVNADQSMLSNASGLPNGVTKVARCDLIVGGDPAIDWPDPAAVDAHWHRRRAANPAYFNGVIHLLYAASFANDQFSGTFFRTDFQTYLYWRDHGAPVGLHDCFGTALIRSRDGHLVFGRQREGINAGLAYPPGGFIDPQDIASDRIDIDGSIEREIGEETGLDVTMLDRRPGYRIAVAPPLVSIAVEYRSDLSSSGLRDTLHNHIASDPSPELAEILMLSSATDVEPTSPAYAKLLAVSVLDASVEV